MRERATVRGLRHSLLKVGGQRGWVAGRQHETAKGSYGLTGNDVFEPTNKATLSVWEATVIDVETGSS